MIVITTVILALLSIAAAQLNAYYLKYQTSSTVGAICSSTSVSLKPGYVVTPNGPCCPYTSTYTCTYGSGTAMNFLLYQGTFVNGAMLSSYNQLYIHYYNGQTQGNQCLYPISGLYTATSNIDVFWCIQEAGSSTGKTN